MVTQDPDRHGYYLAGYKKFYNKTLALIYASEHGFDVRWVFNDKVYSSYDWTIPIETPLSELYKNRAKQLREKYDYLILHYSGGQDSNNILHSFIDNNIKLDEIVIQVPEPERSTNPSTHWSNYWAEIDLQAITYLKSLNLDIKITIEDMSKNLIELLSDRYWIEKVTPNSSYNLGVISRAMGQYKNYQLLDLVDKGTSCCHILGIDKPLVLYDGVDYYCYFIDQNAYHMPPVDKTLNDVYNNNVTEFFYWTPDMPEIVIKQAQEIKKVCIVNNDVRSLFHNTMKINLDLFRVPMQHIIYDIKHAPKFQTEKPAQNAGRILNSWFYNNENKKLVKNYYEGINFLHELINGKYFSGDKELGYTGITSKFYKL